MIETFRRHFLFTGPARQRITLLHGTSASGPHRVSARGGLPACFVVFLALLGAGTGVPAQEPVLRLDGAWVRAMPPGQRMTAAYFRIENTGAEDAVVEGVEASVGNASMHETVRSEDRVRMQAKPRLVIPAGEAVILAPQGLHVMLTELAKTPVEGESIRLCLIPSAPAACVDAPVLRRAPEDSGDDGAMAHRHEDD